MVDPILEYQTMSEESWDLRKKADRNRRKKENTDMDYTPEARVIIGLLKEFNCLTRKQVAAIYEGSKYGSNKLVSFLIKARIAKTVDEVVVLQNRPTYSMEMLHSIWAMLGRIKNGIILDSADIRSAKNAQEDNMCDICFIRNNRTIEYVLFVDETSMTKVSYLQTSFYSTYHVKKGEEAKADVKYIFAINNEDMMYKLEDMQLTIPYEVAYIIGDVVNDVPTVEYYAIEAESVENQE